MGHGGSCWQSKRKDRPTFASLGVQLGQVGDGDAGGGSGGGGATNSVFVSGGSGPTAAAGIAAERAKRAELEAELASLREQAARDAGDGEEPAKNELLRKRQSKQKLKLNCTSKWQRQSEAHP